MKKPIRLLYADKHLHLRNYDLVKSIILQEIDLMNQLGINKVIGLGDEFVSRQAQPLFVLSSFSILHQLYIDNKINRTCIVGNHCKVDYTSENSYLDEFEFHPYMKVVSTVGFEDIDNLRLHFVSYFDERINYKDYLNIAKQNIDKTKYNILLTHILFNGGINNSGDVKSDMKLELEDFSDFDKVLSGHIHNKSSYKNFHYIGSCYPKDFGEDNEKGFTILYSDGSHEFIQSKFPEYHTIEINLDNVDKKDINDLKKQGSQLYKEHGANIRFKITGSEDKVKALNKEEFETLGITVQKEHKSVIKSIAKASIGEINVYDDKKILEKFEDFCKEEEYEDIETGKDYLNKILR